jgi:Fur family ferric uptake transcriptional regulator
MELYGLCPECRKMRDVIIPLSAAKQGEHVIIRDLAGGRKARMRLMAMGLRVGDEIEVLTNMQRGQLVVAADFHRFILGRQMADKIRVEPK